MFFKFGKTNLNPFIFLGDIFQKLAQTNPWVGLQPQFCFAFWQNFAHSKTQVVDCTIMILKFKHEKKYDIKQVRGKFNILRFWRKHINTTHVKVNNDNFLMEKKCSFLLKYINTNVN